MHRDRRGRDPGAVGLPRDGLHQPWNDPGERISGGRFGEPGTALDGATVRDGLRFLEERWDPIIQFDDFQEYMPAPEYPEFAGRWLDMEDILELIWWGESRKNCVTIEDCIRIVEIPDQEGRLRERFSHEAADFIRQLPEEEGAELLGDLRSFLDDSREADAPAVEGTRGNYRVVRPNGSDRG